MFTYNHDDADDADDDDDDNDDGGDGGDDTSYFLQGRAKRGSGGGCVKDESGNFGCDTFKLLQCSSHKLLWCYVEWKSQIAND